MKSHSVLLTTFACVLSVVFSSDYQNYHDLDSSAYQPKPKISYGPPRMPHECHEEFTLAMNDALAEVRNKSLLCAQTVESKKNDFELRNGNARKTFESSVADKMKITQDAMEECSKKVTSAEYFECFQSFKVENRNFLLEIDAKSRDYSVELAAIEREEFYCLSRVVDDKKTRSALSDLRRCLVQGNEPVFKPTSFSTVPPKKDDELDEYVSTFHSTYNTLRSCNKYQEGDYVFDKCLAEANENKELIEFLRKHLPEFFSKLSEIDKAEESCLRHLAAQFIRPTPYRKHLEDCMDKGLSGSSLHDKNYDIIMRDVADFYNLLKDCGSNLSQSDCISRIEWLTYLLKDRLYSMLDEDIEKIVAGSKLDDDGNCMRYALKKIQFHGLFRDDGTKKAFETCFNHN